MMVTLLTLLGLFHVSFSNHPIDLIELEGRIVNGIPTSANLYPWMVSLRQQVFSVIVNSFCGGALIEIDPPIILTAAHCVDFFRYNESDNTIRDNSNYINELYADINRTYPEDIVAGDTFQTLSISIDEIYMHPKWNGSAIEGYDIALIIFDDNQTVNLPIDELPTIQAKLSLPQPCCTVGESLEAIGYGKNATDGVGTFSLEETVLHYVDTIDCAMALLAAANVTGIDRSDIELLYASNPDESIVCVMGDDTNICQGDSGGPLFRYINGNAYKPEIIGVASATIGGCNNGYPSIYTSVGHYYDWIMKTIDFQIDGITYSPTVNPTNLPTKTPTNYPTTAMPTTSNPTMDDNKEPASINNLFCVYSCIVSMLFMLYM